jgi:hypothetical protein
MYCLLVSRRGDPSPLGLQPTTTTDPMTTLLIALIFKLFLPLLVLIALIDLLSQTQPQRIRRLSTAGFSQASIAQRLGVTRYRVRLALA